MGVNVALTPELERSAQIAAFNHELEQRLASLDRGEKIDAEEIRRRIEAKSKARRLGK